MKNLKALILGLGLTASFGLSACNDGLGDLKKVKDEACACKDMACAAGIGEKLKKLEGEVKESDEAEEVLAELTKCLTSAMAPPAP